MTAVFILNRIFIVFFIFMTAICMRMTAVFLKYRCLHIISVCFLFCLPLLSMVHPSPYSFYTPQPSFFVIYIILFTYLASLFLCKILGNMRRNIFCFRLPYIAVFLFFVFYFYPFYPTMVIVEKCLFWVIFYLLMVFPIAFVGIFIPKHLIAIFMCLALQSLLSGFLFTQYFIYFSLGVNIFFCTFLREGGNMRKLGFFLKYYIGLY